MAKDSKRIRSTQSGLSGRTTATARSERREPKGAESGRSAGGRAPLVRADELAASQERANAAFEALSEVARLLNESVHDAQIKPTSLRLNSSVWAAANVAVEHGWAPSLTTLVEQSVSTRLSELATQAAEQSALDEHYERHPEARSELWELALAAAEIDGSLVADHPELLRDAVASLGDRADIDSALAWAEGALSASAT